MRQPRGGIFLRPFELPFFIVMRTILTGHEFLLIVLEQPINFAYPENSNFEEL